MAFRSRGVGNGSHIHFMEKVVEQLKKEGWKEQQSGIDFFNGMLSVNLLQDGEVISIRFVYRSKGIRWQNP